MKSCSCMIEGNIDGEAPVFYSSKVVTARKQHVCCECNKPIPVGTKYERYTAKWESDPVITHKTCLICKEIRDVLFCGWTFTSMFDDLDEYILEVDGQVPESCITQLSEDAKKVVLDAIDAYIKEAED